MRTDIILLVTSLISVAWTRPRARDDIEPLIASDQCLVELDYASNAWQDLGVDADELCDEDGEFIQAYDLAASCIVANADTATAVVTVTELDVPRSICSLTAEPTATA